MTDDDEVTSPKMVSTIPIVRGHNYSEIREGIGHWNPTPQQVREVILGDGLRGMMPDRVRPEHRSYIPAVDTITIASVVAKDAIRGGRLIDFGEWTNEAIIAGSNRGGPMWQAGGLPLPFNNSFIFMHTWRHVFQDEPYTASGVYLVVPLTDEMPGVVDVTELQAMMLSGERRLTYGDRVQMSPDAGNKNGYTAIVQPNIWRFVDGFEFMNENAHHQRHRELEQHIAGAAASNICDPTILALLILNTRNIPRETIRASEKLLRARMRSGKSPIPPYDVVNSEMYITALTRSRARHDPEPGGGTHRSPIPHVRLGHLREYPSGRSAVIDSTMVNVPPEARASFKSARSHYVVK